MISTRWAFSTAVLLALALVPTVVHTYLGYRADDGRKATSIGTTLDGLTSTSTDRSAKWVGKVLGTYDWIERQYGATPGLILFVGRTYDPKRLYHHPENALSYPRATLGRPEVVHLRGRPEIPVFVLRGIDSDRTLVVYALRYRDGFVGNPYLTQAVASLRLLVSGRQPMTLFYVEDPQGAARGQVPIDGAPAARLLVAAIDSYLAQSPVPRSPSGSSGT